MTYLARALGILCVLFVIGASPAHAAVGRTAGEFAVSPTGAATYSIPIWTPPGVAGLSPSLALVYSSRSGDGLVGMGWNIAGLSNIARCARTFAQDGVAGPPALATTDRFCVDGNRLRAFAGTTYGADGALYQTELADFSLVISHGTTGVGPAWFEVRKKNGLIYEYGNSTASKIIPSGATSIRTWALSKIRDRVGNYIVFDYINDTTNGVFRPNTITYTSSPGTAATPHFQVQFAYQSRADVVKGGVLNTLFQEANRLTQVTIAAWNGASYATARYYALTYGLGATTGRSQLQQVQECSPTQCLAPTAISYQAGTAGWGSTLTATSGGIPLDLNGDGVEDLIYANSGTGTWYYMLGQGSGTYSTAYNTGQSSSTSASALRINFYGNGKYGLLVPNGSGFWRALLFQSVGSTFTYVDTTAPTTYSGAGVAAAIDVNGDGRDDLVYGDAAGGAYASGIYQRLNTGSGFGAETLIRSATAQETFGTQPLLTMQNPQASTVRKVDFNGDGRGDIVVWTNFCNQGVGLCTGAQLKFYWSILVSQADVTFVRGAKPTMGGMAPIYGDMNGDGCSDFVHAGTATQYFLIVMYSGCGSAADGAFPRTLTTTISTNTLGTTVLLADWDGDALDDIIAYNTASATWGYIRSDGTNVGTWTSLGFGGSASGVTDANGDSLPDLLFGSSYRLHSGTFADLATSITDGFGVNVSPSYGSTAQGNYTAYADAAYPEADSSGPIVVVTGYSASNGIGGTYSVTESYFGARVNLQGRGFLGFERKREIDSRNSLQSNDYYYRTFPFTGLLSGRKVYQSNGSTLISEVATTPASSGQYTLDSTANNQRYFPFVTQSTANQYEYPSGAWVTQTVSSWTYDSYGNALTTQVQATDKDSSSPWVGQTFASLTTVTPSIDSSTGSTGWCVGLPTQVTVKRTKPDSSFLTRTTGYSVDATGLCRLTAETVEPGSSTLQVQSTFGYDTCGNRNSVSVVGKNPDGSTMATRTTSANFGTTCTAPETRTNALSQSASTSYRYDLVLPTSVGDENGLATSYTYNDLGQLTQITRPDGTYTVVDRGACNAGNGYCGVADLRYDLAKYEYSSTGTLISDAYYYHDAFDRLRYDFRRSHSGSLTTRVTTYDALGRLSQQSMPAFAGAYWTTVGYDGVNRVTSVSRPIDSANSTLQSTTYAYSGRTLTISDPKSNVVKKQFDVIGDLLILTDPDGVSKTMYGYDHFGLINSATDQANNVSLWNYDLRGHLTSTSDPDRGPKTYQSNSLGELVNLRDAKTSAPSWTQTLSYDLLGRVTSRTEPEGTTTWTWGTPADNTPTAKYVGRLKQLSGLSYVETLSYDLYGRPATRAMQWNGGTTYTASVAYNTLGSIDTLTYPASTGSPLAIKYAYSNGYVSSLQDYTGGSPGTVYWKLTPSVTAVDAWDHVIDETLGNGVRTISGFDAVTGWIGVRQTSSSGLTNNLQNLVYQWDKNGNLSQRQDVRQSITEAFSVDALNRVTGSTRNGTTNLTVTYDATGNITGKGDGASTVGYTYDSVHKHAVASAGGVSYVYDANGNMNSRGGSSISWASFNLPTVINGSTYSSTFSYGGDHQRKQQVATYSTGSETTLYVGRLMEIVTSSSTMYKHLVPTPSGTQIVITRVLGGGASIAYVSTDHLGSGDVISDAAGNVAALVRESFTAFGQRRGADWTLATAPDYTGVSQTTRHGFTFHEHLDNVVLTHMNGRVYDPAVGRFISADPVFDGLGSPGGSNPYSYVRNLPTTLIDPDGLSEKNPASCQGCKKAEQGNPTLPPGSTGTPSNPTNQGSVTVTSAGPGYSGVSVNVANMWGGLVIVSSGDTEISAGAVDEVIATSTRTRGGNGGSSTRGGGTSTATTPRIPPKRSPKACRDGFEKWIQSAAGAAGGGAGGLVSGGGLPGLFAGATAGGVTGFVTGSLSGAGAPGWFTGAVGAPTGAVSTAFAAELFVSGGASAGGMLVAGYGGFAGGYFNGAVGAGAGAGVGSVYGLAQVARIGFVGSTAAFVAALTYAWLDAQASDYCGI